MGRGNIMPSNGAQIAIRPPDDLPDTLDNPDSPDNPEEEITRARDLSKLTPLRWHCDGYSEGYHSPFTLLVGVVLTEQTRPNMGNFTVIPGSHLTFLRPLRQV